MHYQTKTVVVYEKDAKGNSVKGTDGKNRVAASEDFECPVLDPTDVRTDDQGNIVIDAQAIGELLTKQDVVDRLNYGIDLKMRTPIRDRINPYADVSLETMRSSVMVHLSKMANSDDEDVAADAQQQIQQFILAEANWTGKAWIKAMYKELFGKQ